MHRYLLIASISILLPASLQAQLKLPVYEEPSGNIQNVVFENTKGPAAFQHGRWVRITLDANGKDVIQGIVVRTDPEKGLLYLRTRPGLPPRAIPIADIKQVKKGVIKTVSYSGDYTAPEIHELIIFNGPKRTVAYSAPTLSGGELAALADLQSAENQLARAKFLASLEDQVLVNDLVLRIDQQNEFAAQFAAVGLLPYQPYGYVVRTRNGVFWLGNSNNVPTAAPFPLMPTGPSGNGGDLLTTATRNYWLARSHVLVENGRVVAVVTNGPTEKSTVVNP